jgi:mono/diheme cytochrome c family protein
MKISAHVVSFGIFFSLWAPLGIAQEPDQIRFNEDIRPILAANCFGCHGLDAGQRKADLRLDTPEGAFTTRDGMTPIKPGDLAGSEVWQRITSDDAELVMPPPASKKTLTAAEKERIRRWIEAGAPFQKHWSFEPVTRRAVPAVRNEAWPTNSVDRFILSRLEREGLEPRPQADRPTLIRRVAFALSGLPPTVEEVSAFLTDTSPNAYERMVERYLDSPHFGEEMARHWLDVARYADTHGLHLDNEREMWAYRDWVVKAFNDNLPFDQFTIWQLAGDLLPRPTREQLTATGFNRCNVTTGEGGSITEELLYRYAVDRTSTFVQTWMGLTGGCCQCHDHKYDPISIKEFYSLYAFFYSNADPGMDGNLRDTAPFIKIPTPEQETALKEAQERDAAARKQLDAALSGIADHDPADAMPAPAPRTVTDVWLDDDFPPGAKVRNTSRNRAEWVLEPESAVKSGRRALELANSGHFDVFVEFGAAPLVIPRQGRLEAWLRVDPRHAPATFAIQFDDGKKSRRAVWGAPDSSRGDASTTDMGPLPAAGEFAALVVPFEKLGLEPGTRLKALVFTETGGQVWLDRVQVVGETDPATDPLSSFRAWWKSQENSEAASIPAELREVLKAGPEKEASPELREKLKHFYLTSVQRIADSPVPGLRQAAEEARLARVIAEEAIPGTFVFRDLETPRDAFVMLRGQYDKPGEKVEPNVPVSFPALRKERPDARATRLDLARWLVAPEHPLTARVTVNRVWQQLFGTGLVKTSYDFGTQGEPPSHPELLDWLALSFRENGWNVKDLVRLLVTSATFRQDSTTTPELRKRDPENRLYAHGPRFRLDAEQIRDNVLAVSGLIDLTMGGRGVRIYQPPNIWEPVGYADSNTRYYLQDHGQSLYRRSLYCFLKRTAPPPFMTNFDGPSREQYCARRERSNTPLQALQLMNDVQHFEAARALAERAIAEGGPDAPERIDFLYETVLARHATPDERRLLEDLLAKERALFEADPAAAHKAIHVGESAPKGKAADPETAAWTIVANLLLNLDETVTRN